MDKTMSDRKQLMENMVMHRHPMQLSESGDDMITFSLPHHDPSSVCFIIHSLFYIFKKPIVNIVEGPKLIDIIFTRVYV